jgi:hypothetical protein
MASPRFGVPGRRVSAPIFEEHRVVPGSFRDPSGFVFTRNGALFRQVNRVYGEHYDRLMQSGLYAAVSGSGLLVGHEECDAPAPNAANAYKVVRPERIPFISYPYEWSFGQLKAAALLTLQVEKIARQHGMSLKDASAYNVQFKGSDPILIDTLSFQIHREGEPWVAYRQFCQFFVAPLALMSACDARLNQLLRVFIDGVPLEIASRLLPWQTRFNGRLGLHVHLHASAQKRYAGKREQPTAGRTPRMGQAAQAGLIDSLETTIRRIEWEPKGTVWADYYDDTNYTDAAFHAKKALVSRFLDAVRPRVVWDLGANDGRFSRLASDSGIPTMSFDMDPAAVEKNYRESVRRRERHLLPLVLDLSNPSSGIGWAGEERMSLESRGPADLVMALALVHHLAIGNNVPLDRVADLFSALGRSLVIEFVPKSDSQVQRLLGSREDVFPSYTQHDFEAAFAERFELLDVAPIPGSERTLYLMKRSR